jgi:hypothetical protein
MIIPYHYRKILDYFNAKPAHRELTWLAKCPAHDDRKPSLRIWIGNNGNMVIRCYAGCSLQNVLQASGVKMQELFPDYDGTRTERPKPRIVAEYIYRDEEGRPLFRKLRFEPKSFCIERSENDKWQPGLFNTRRLLYNLDKIVKNVDKPILIVEGEKDADNASKLLKTEIISTTNLEGASGINGHWRDEYSKTLKGRTVYIIPDNDSPGFNHAYHVMGSLLCHGVHKIHFVSLPGLPPSEDLSWWIEHGGSKENLMKIIEDSPAFCEEW